MKLEKGMIARTKHNGIQKVAGHHDNKIEFITRYGEGFIIVYKKIEDFVVKTSHNIIDLIEVGDIVKVCDCFHGHIDEIYIIDDKDGGNSLETLKAIIDKSGYELKEILTHEQYEANCYKVSE